MTKTFLKQIIIVTVIALCAGILIAKKELIFTKIFHAPYPVSPFLGGSTSSPVVSGDTAASPIPTPAPTLPPLTQSSNLSTENQTLSPADFTEDFTKLSTEVKNF